MSDTRWSTDLGGAGQTLFVAEPRALWAQRPAVVVDCSVMAAMLFAEASAKDAARELAQHVLHAPTLLPYEMASVAAKKLRAGEQADTVTAALTDFNDQRIELHAVAPEASLALAERYSLSCYDAAYLWLAAELQAPLVTFDRQLASAAKRHLGAAS
jgi:predicted nucleic acid-binding protein